uniref:Uncharacterized protein n=1 Tax=Cucumis melo TaxID=3656 RepID=A0A9I9E8D8_CUCME
MSLAGISSLFHRDRMSFKAIFKITVTHLKCQCKGNFGHSTKSSGAPLTPDAIPDESLMVSESPITPARHFRQTKMALRAPLTPDTISPT